MEVTLHHLVTIVANPGLALEWLRRQVWHVPHREWQGKEEGLPCRRVPPHEFDCPVGQLVVDVGWVIGGKGLHRPEGPARRRLDDLWATRQEVVDGFSDGMGQHHCVDVGCSVPGDAGRNTVELVEAMC